MEALQFEICSRFVEVLALRGRGRGGMECSLIPLIGVVGMGLFVTPCLSKWDSM